MLLIVQHARTAAMMLAAVLALHATSAAADSIERVFDAVARDAGKVLSDASRPTRAIVNRFRHAEGDITCAPLSDRLRDGLANALIAHVPPTRLSILANSFSLDSVDLIFSGTWRDAPRGRVVLEISAGRWDGDRITRVLGREFVLRQRELGDVGACMLEVVHHGGIYVALKDLSVRASPAHVSEELMRIKEGSRVEVIGQIAGGAWKIVRLGTPEDDFPRQGEERGFLYGKRGIALKHE